jgi:hypothetical protein
MPLRHGQGLLRTLQSIVESTLEQVCLSQPRELHRPSDAQRAHRRCVLYHLFEKIPTLGRTRGDCARVSETGEDRPGLEVRRNGEDARALQRIDGPTEITPSEAYARDAREGFGKSERVVSVFRDPECLLRMRARINESPYTRERQSQPAV